MYGGLREQGSLYPMCGMNLAFDRQLIGPAMYFGLMGDGQPLGRYDDMWAGWCSKVGAHTCACFGPCLNHPGQRSGTTWANSMLPRPCRQEG